MDTRKMHKGLVAMTAALGLLAGSGAAFAQQAKIGFVNVSRVFESTQEGKSILQRLQSEHQQKQLELDKRTKAFEEKAKEFQQQGPMLKDEVKKDRLQSLAKEEKELQMLYMQFQGDINNKKTEALSKFEGKVMEVVQALARREGLDYILRQDVLLFGPDKMDLTSQVIREYDKKYAGGDGPKSK